MNFYENELQALKRAGRYRSREVFDSGVLDFASNDYLGFSHKKELHSATCTAMDSLSCHTPKASMLVNGYHQIHKDFERALCGANGFEDGVVLGSGFCANIALVESLVRKGDILFMDEKCIIPLTNLKNLFATHIPIHRVDTLNRYNLSLGMLVFTKKVF